MNLNRLIFFLLRGGGRALELRPDSRDRLSRIHPYTNDQAALARDWTRVGQDFWTVINREPRPDHP